MVRALAGAAWLLLALLASGPWWAQEDASSALLAVVEVEREMLTDARERYAAVARRGAELMGEMELLREALDVAIAETESPDYRRINLLADQIERAETERAGLLAGERLLVERIAQHLQRLEAFEARMAALQNREEQGEGLSGTWDLVLMPEGQRGVAGLLQTGALVSGTYELEGDWKGSLQGTLVNRKVFLVRIDSKLGKSMELEGYLSSDGQRIRGSWLNYELSGREGGTGQWTAQRRQAR